MSFSRQVAPAALLAALALAGAPARAQPLSAPAPGQSGQGSLALLGSSLAQKLGPAARGAAVAIVELKSDRELSVAAAAALRERVQGAVATALGAESASAPRERSKLRVELSVEKSGGVLRATAELRRALGLWQRVRHDKPRPEQRAFAEVPLDAELRALIPPPPLVVSQALKLKAPERGIVALACGPLAGDGGQELVLVSRSSVRVGRIVGGAFAERKRAAWAALSPVAPAPLREPIASAQITPEGTLRVGSSDRRDGLELSSELGVVQRFEGLLPVAGGCLARAELGISSALGPCSAQGGPAVPAAPLVLDALGGAAPGLVGRELKSSKLVGSLPELAHVELRVGAELAAGDADSDGAPELAYSADTLEPGKDRLTLVTLQSDKRLVRFELAAPAISAITICSKREGAGMAPIVLASGDQLWLLR